MMVQMLALSNAGATRRKRDSVDARIVSEVRNGILELVGIP